MTSGDIDPDARSALWRLRLSSLILSLLVALIRWVVSSGVAL